MLKSLGLQSLHLLTNNPDKVEQLEKYGITFPVRYQSEIEGLNPYDVFI